jgi:hypothetical protein
MGSGGVLLPTPVAVAVWLQHEVAESAVGGWFWLWNATGARWEKLCPAPWALAIRSRVVACTTRGEDFYGLTVCPITGSWQWFADMAVNGACPLARCRHHSSRRVGTARTRVGVL